MPRNPPPPQPPTCSVAIATRRPDAQVSAETVHAVLERGSAANAAAGMPAPTLVPHMGLALLHGLTPSALLSALGTVTRDPALVACVWFVPPTQPSFSATREIPRARRSPTGLHFPRWPLDGSAEGAAAVVSLHAAVLRARTPAQWRTVEALARHRTQTAAAMVLGCSHQAVGRTARRANAGVTGKTITALAPLVASISTAAPAAPAKSVVGK